MILDFLKGYELVIKSYDWNEQDVGILCEEFKDLKFPYRSDHQLDLFHLFRRLRLYVTIWSSC